MPEQHMVFSTHLDDDIIFMNNDILEAISAGEELTTVYLVTGDPARELGIKAAYSEMAGSDDWVDETVVVGGKSIASSYLASNPDVRHYYLRFPDQGGGNSTSEQLYDGAVSSVTTDDGETYTRADLTETLTGIMDLHQPDNIMKHGQEISANGGDHGEHIHFNEFIDDALVNYSTSHDVDDYLGYSVAGLDANVTGADLAAKTAVFEAYGQFDTNALNIPVFRDWLERQYQVDPDGRPTEEDWDIRGDTSTSGGDLTSSVSGRYFVDANGDGLQTGSDVGVAGAVVQLYDDVSYRVLAETRTDANGNYSFDNVDPSPRLAVFFQNPTDLGAAYDNYDFTQGNQGGDEDQDSDVRSTIGNGFGEVDRFSLAPGQNVTNIDVGIVETGAPSTPDVPDTPDEPDVPSVPDEPDTPDVPDVTPPQGGTDAPLTLDGGRNGDMLNGERGDDLLRGRGGDDTLNGGDGDDTLAGGVGNDVMNGGADDDRLNGARGADVLDGGTGNDFLNGGRDNDTLTGGAGNDRLNGGAGNDVLRAGDGQDTVSGGAGDDVFVLQDAAGSVLITDFKANGAEDMLDLSQLSGYDTPAALAAVTSQVGDDTVFRFEVSDGTLSVRVRSEEPLSDDDFTLSGPADTSDDPSTEPPTPDGPSDGTPDGTAEFSIAVTRSNEILGENDTDMPNWYQLDDVSQSLTINETQSLSIDLGQDPSSLSTGTDNSQTITGNNSVIYSVQLADKLVLSDDAGNGYDAQAVSLYSEDGSTPISYNAFYVFSGETPPTGVTLTITSREAPEDIPATESTDPSPASAALSGAELMAALTLPVSPQDDMDAGFDEADDMDFVM